MLNTIFAALDDSLPVAYFIVQHCSAEHDSILDSLLGNITSMPVHKVDEEMEISPGHVYVSNTDRHLIIDKDKVCSFYGPRHNKSRPSVDVLFSSAALAHSNRVVGIILTGLLTDGTIGLRDIRQRGGTTIVQDPDEADYDEMPRNALRQNDVDYIAHSSELASLLGVLCRRKPSPLISEEPPEELVKKVELSQSAAIKELDKEKHLSEKKFSLNDNKQAILNTLWSLVRIMQEQSNMLENMAAGEYINQRDKLAKRYQEKAMESRSDTVNLRKLLQDYTIVRKDETEKSPTEL